MTDPVTVWMSCAALCISIGSLVVSTLNYRRDRAKLRVTSVFSPDDEYGLAIIRLSIANVGRRPVILRSWGGSTNGGTSWSARYFGNFDEGLRLGENEAREVTLTRQDLVMGPDNDLLEDLWVEDSLGNRHSPKGARSQVSLLWNSSDAGMGVQRIHPKGG